MRAWKPDWPIALVVGLGLGSLAGAYWGRMASTQETISELPAVSAPRVDKKLQIQKALAPEKNDFTILRLSNPKAPIYIRPKDFLLREDTSGWVIRVHSPAGKLVRSFRGSSSLPKQIAWDGRDDRGVLLEDRHLATYTLELRDAASGSTKTAPAKGVFTFVEPVLRQRTDDPRRGLAIEFRMGRLPLAEPPKNWSLEILDRQGKTVGRFAGSHLPPESLLWDASGHVRSVEYSYRFYVWPQSGKRLRVDGTFLGVPTEKMPSVLPMLPPLQSSVF